MNGNNKESLIYRVKQKAAHVALVASTSMAVAAPAFAGGGGPDVTAVDTEMQLYKVAAVGLAIAFAVVLWAIRGTSLLKPK